MKTQKKERLNAWRNPTKAEIAFGYGAIHWAEFPIDCWKKPDGGFYRWRKFGGLRYKR